MSEKNPWYQGVLGWLRDVIPTSLAVVISFYQYWRQKLSREEARHDKTKLENEKLKNELEVEKDHSAKSDSDIIAEAIRDGKRLRDRNKKS